jgi:hypothetical protein
MKVERFLTVQVWTSSTAVSNNHDVLKWLTGGNCMTLELIDDIQLDR